MLTKKLRESGGLEIVEVILSVIIIALILWEIRIGYKGMKASGEELSLLRQQVSSLNESAEALAGATGVLRQQLGLLSSQQKARLAEEKRKPRLQLFVDGVRLTPEFKGSLPSRCYCDQSRSGPRPEKRR